MAMSAEKLMMSNAIFTQSFGPSALIALSVAGEVGFEPTDGGSKGRCLTTWRLPNKLSLSCYRDRCAITHELSHAENLGGEHYYFGYLLKPMDKTFDTP